MDYLDYLNEISKAGLIQLIRSLREARGDEASLDTELRAALTAEDGHLVTLEEVEEAQAGFLQMLEDQTSMDASTEEEESEIPAFSGEVRR